MTREYTLSITYTLHTASGPEYKNDTVTVPSNMRPSEVEMHVAKRWSIVRECPVTVQDMVVDRVTQVETVEHKPEDRYHVRYSA